MSLSHKDFEGLYLHIPFCYPAKCDYCSFYSLAHDGNVEVQFLDALQKEVGLVAEGCSPKTVFIGGGTPSALTETGLMMLFDALSQFDLSNVFEFSCEVNPNSLTREKLEILVEGGVNRLSIGAQSFSPNALSTLGRCHEPGDVHSAVELCHRTGLENISLDLISDVPGTTVEDWKKDLAAASEMAIKHLSVYCLGIEPSTRLAQRVALGEVEPISDDDSARRMRLTRDFLLAHGFIWYEISNYARQHRYSAHNSIYWRNGSYLGLGPSAVSYDGAERRRNSPDLSSYCEALHNGKLPVFERERLSASRKAGETAMLMLRRRKGIDPLEFLNSCGLDFETEFRAVVQELMDHGFLERHEGCIRIPDDKVALSDTVNANFVEA